jgi:RNA polymerase sigma-70 factor (ECF subfamily)
LVKPHRAALREYVWRLTDGDEDATESIIKEALYRAAQEPALYPTSPSAVRPWLVLTARNVFRDGERFAPAGHDDRPFWPPSRGSGPASPVPATTVIAAIEELPATHRKLIVELFYDGVSLEEAAADRDVPVETIKYRLYFAMRALHTVLDKHTTRNGAAGRT